MSSNEPVRNECEEIYEMFHILNCGFENQVSYDLRTDHSLLDFRSAVQYMKYFIYHFTFTGFIAELVRASHRYRGVTGSNSHCNPSGCGAVLRGHTWIVFRGRAPRRQHSSFGPSSLNCVLRNSVWDCKKKTISKSDISYQQMQKPDRLFVAHL